MPMISMYKRWLHNGRSVDRLQHYEARTRERSGRNVLILAFCERIRCWTGKWYRKGPRFFQPRSDRRLSLRLTSLKLCDTADRFVVHIGRQSQRCKFTTGTMIGYTRYGVKRKNSNKLSVYRLYKRVNTAKEK